MKYNPLHIYYMITIQCNQKCTKCSHWKQKDKADRLPIEKIVQAIKSISTAKEFCIVGVNRRFLKPKYMILLMAFRICQLELQ